MNPTGRNHSRNPAVIRYRKNPEYRQQVIRAVRQYQELHRNDPTFQELVATRKRICAVRSQIERWMERYQERVTALEKQLFELIARRDELVAQRRAFGPVQSLDGPLDPNQGSQGGQ